MIPLIGICYTFSWSRHQNVVTPVKETKSATMNIFRKKYFLFKSFVKVELSYVFTINLIPITEIAWKSELSYKNKCFFSLVGDYLRPSNNYRRLIFNINAVILILIIC